MKNLKRIIDILLVIGFIALISLFAYEVYAKPANSMDGVMWIVIGICNLLISARTFISQDRSKTMRIISVVALFLVGLWFIVRGITM